MRKDSTNSQSAQMRLNDIPLLEELYDEVAPTISGGVLGISVPLPPPSAVPLKPGTQADIDRLSTSLFGGPIFPGLDPEFP
jgi:hypothetical protein